MVNLGTQGTQFWDSKGPFWVSRGQIRDSRGQLGDNFASQRDSVLGQFVECRLFRAPPHKETFLELKVTVLELMGTILGF